MLIISPNRMDAEEIKNCTKGVRITYFERSRYNLGNKPTSGMENALISSMIESGELFGTKVWAFVHSDSSIKAGEVNPFGCGFDSGQSGFAYITRAELIDEFNGDETIAMRTIHDAVEMYNAWMNGRLHDVVDSETDEIIGSFNSWEEAHEYMVKAKEMLPCQS